MTCMLMAFVLTACENKENDLSAYTVWTTTVTYDDYQKKDCGTIRDEEYKSLSLTTDDAANFKTLFGLTDGDARSMTKTGIYSWLYSAGFGSTEATQQSNRFIIYPHYMIVIRQGQNVHIILR